MSVIDNIALTGLSAAKKNLEVTGSNIANTSSPWYSRLEVIQTSHQLCAGTNTNSQLLGTKVLDVRRILSQVINEQCWQIEGDFEYANTYTTYLSQLETIFGEDSTNLSTVLDEWISSLSEAVADPSIMAYREQILSKSLNLAERFNFFHSRVSDLVEQGLNHMKSIAKELNVLLENVAYLNKQIVSSGENGCVDLLNERDRLISEVGVKIDIDVIEDATGAINLNLKSGHALVAGNSYNTIDLGNNENQLFNSTIYLSRNRANTTQEINQVGGQLGAIHNFINNDVEKALSDLGWLALQISHGTNRQLIQGLDLEGNKGVNLFSDMNTTSDSGLRISKVEAQGSAEPRVYIDDNNLNKITSDTYQVTLNNYSYNDIEVFNETKGVNVIAIPSGDAMWTFDGLIFKVDNYDLARTGDKYHINHCRDGSRLFDVVLDNPSQLAFSEQRNAYSDNGNLKKVLNFINYASLHKGTLSFANEQMVTYLANAVSEAQSLMNAYEISRENFYTQRTSISGVDLDEEASNLIRFQQYYQANAKVLVVQKEIIDTLLAI